MANIRRQNIIEISTPITENPPTAAQFADGFQIKVMNAEAFFNPIELLNFLVLIILDERVPIKHIMLPIRSRLA
jgi:hypothetical protein